MLGKVLLVRKKIIKSAIKSKRGRRRLLKGKCDFDFILLLKKIFISFSHLTVLNVLYSFNPQKLKNISLILCKYGYIVANLRLWLQLGSLANLSCFTCPPTFNIRSFQKFKTQYRTQLGCSILDSHNI